MHVLRPTFLVLVLLGLAGSAAVPGVGAQDARPPSPADPADVGSVDAILTAVYDVISGPAGEVRDWDRFRSLFAPGARLIPTGSAGTDGYRFRDWSPEEYVATAGRSLERDGFFEKEIHRVEERYGPVLHAFSTYESRRTLGDPEPFARGVNSFQLWWDGDRWWVMNIFWFGEEPGEPIPERYLPGV